MEEAKLTPAQAQYRAMKEKYPDALLFFRMGDFYEMFGEDAIRGAKVLGLTLTSREKKAENRIPMAGVPHHSVNKYIAQLTKKGYKIALCEQLSDPKLPGIVQRDVVRVITPGTVVEEELLDSAQHNYLVCLTEKNNIIGVSGLDVSTGDFFVYELDNVSRLFDELYKLTPSEIIFVKNQFFALDVLEQVRSRFPDQTTQYANVEDPYEILIRHFQTHSLAGFGVDHLKVAVRSAGYLLTYAKDHQRTDMSHILKLQPSRFEQAMYLDETVIRHLELVRNSYDGKKEGSLLFVLDRTCTGSGARLLYDWLLHPLLVLSEIAERHTAVEALVRDNETRDTLRQKLKNMFDLERLVAKLVMKKGLPRDLLAIAQTLEQGKEIQQILRSVQAPLIDEAATALQSEILDRIIDLVRRSIDPEVTGMTDPGHAIRAGYHAEVDELRSITRDGKTWMAQYQQQEQARTGISTLKVAFNQVFGYYIEVSKGQLSKIPGDYVRKQTLVNAERFITQELKEYEHKVLHAEERLIALEQKILLELQEQILAGVAALKAFADTTARLDVLQSFAQVAIEHHYAKPELCEDGYCHIQEGRHPVVERFLDVPFIHNDLNLSEQYRIGLITGPNMAGKSTYLRQNALIVLMAQIGSFVPAKEARICITDRIFTRIGASDILTRGQSTFLVEMQETANILNNATPKSFVILDEIGRGTSTYDGLSLAWGIFEYLHNVSGAKVLFATHYHELVALAESLPAAFNLSMAVSEHADGVTFLRKVVPGGVDKSYGIEVAKISGLPAAVIQRATTVLESLESRKKQENAASAQLSFLQPQVTETVKIVKQDSEVEKKLSSLDLNQLTPLEALNVLHEMKQGIRKDDSKPPSSL